MEEERKYTGSKGDPGRKEMITEQRNKQSKKEEKLVGRKNKSLQGRKVLRIREKGSMYAYMLGRIEGWTAENIQDEGRTERRREGTNDVKYTERKKERKEEVCIKGRKELNMQEGGREDGCMKEEGEKEA